MSNRLLIIGYVLIEYLGEKPIDYRGKVPVGARKFMKVEKGDIVVADEVTAIIMCKGTQWKKIESDVDISNLLMSKYNQSQKEFDDCSSLMTQSNLDDYSDEELIAFAKEKGVTGANVRSKREKLIPLILPFLPIE